MRAGKFERMVVFPKSVDKEAILEFGHIQQIQHNPTQHNPAKTHVDEKSVDLIGPSPNVRFSFFFFFLVCLCAKSKV